MTLFSSKRIISGLAFLAAAIAVPALASAGTVSMTAGSVTLSQSGSVQTGFIDVTLKEVGGSDAAAGFGVQLTSSNAAIKFIAASDGNNGNSAANQATYIYAGNTSNPKATFQSPSTAPAASAFETDVPLNGTAPLMTSTSVDILQVQYSIPANFSGTSTLTITTTGSFAAFWDDTAANQNNILPGNVTNGLITVTPTATPEPSSVVLMLLGAAGLFGVRRLRRA